MKPLKVNVYIILYIFYFLQALYFPFLQHSFSPCFMPVMIQGSLAPQAFEYMAISSPVSGNFLLLGTPIYGDFATFFSKPQRLSPIVSPLFLFSTTKLGSDKLKVVVNLEKRLSQKSLYL